MSDICPGCNNPNSFVNFIDDAFALSGITVLFILVFLVSVGIALIINMHTNKKTDRKR